MPLPRRYPSSSVRIDLVAHHDTAIANRVKAGIYRSPPRSVSEATAANGHGAAFYRCLLLFI